MDEFQQAAKEAGFSMKQIEFFEEWVARVGHTHDVTEVGGLEEYVEELVGDDEEGDEE